MCSCGVSWVKKW